jgi:hypothetical protein
MFTIGLFYWLAKLILLHPFHVSVCDIEYETEDKHLKISVRVFLDDLELGLRDYSSEPYLDIMDESNYEFVHEKLEEYLLKNLQVYRNGKRLELTYLGEEREIDVMWCYLEVEKLRPFSELAVQNTLLHEIYDDQENLVHIRKDGKVKSMRLLEDQPKAEVSW